MSKTIIVGAGINGLLLGAMLSHDGDEVVIFEKNNMPGGRAVLQERDGFTLDYGVHLTRFGPKSSLAAIMKHLGVKLSFTKMGVSYCVDKGGKTVLFPTSPGGIFKTTMFTFSEKMKLIGLILKIKKGKYNEGLMDVSLRDWMNRNGITDGVKRYLELLSASVMVCPFIEKTSAGEMFRNLYRVFKTGHSAEYLSNGWKPVYAKLYDTINKKGEIRCGQKVDEVIIRNGKAVGVRVGRKIWKADRVVINIPVQGMFSVLPAKLFDRGYVKLCKNLLPTSGIFFDIALKEVISNVSGLLYTYHPMTYGFITSNAAPGIAPEGKQLLTVLYPVTLEDCRDPKMREKRKKELWRAIKKYFPRIEKQVLWVRETALKMVDGVQVNIDQHEELRPGPEVPGIGDLYLVGDSIAAPGAGGDVGNESVLKTYGAITGRMLPS